MGSFYSILRIASKIKSKRIKLFGIWAYHMLGRRYFGIFIDPVLACNFRCRMCYFSDPAKRSEMKGMLSREQIDKIAHSLFHRAMKLQIGCGAEPTLDKNLTYIVRLGREYKIPFISITTNGYLITKDILTELAASGLNELTLSMHGTTKKTYESLMVNGDFDRFKSLLSDFAEVNAAYPDMKLRINYTVNEDNVEELAGFMQLMEGIPLDTLQLRPVQQIGNSDYSNFSLDKVNRCYDSVIEPLITNCKKRGITIIAPTKQNISCLEEVSAVHDQRIEKATYFYVSPRHCWRPEYDYREYRFEEFCRKHNVGMALFKSIFCKTESEKELTKKMNYTVK